MGQRAMGCFTSATTAELALWRSGSRSVASTAGILAGGCRSVRQDVEPGGRSRLRQEGHGRRGQEKNQREAHLGLRPVQSWRLVGLSGVVKGKIQART